ncbi:Oligopeptide transport system permease OppC [Klebsiella pneumoniae subsp. pneumoniae]|nr:Oligopeptide transport system permease OppC [Klebsiella pneumoniae subsp. pneumoniae]
MMLSKKNSEALENFSEKLEVEGRSLWQDARRRFMHNRAAVTSLIMLVLIALFVTFAPMVSSFSYFDTDWGMMSNAPDMASGHYFGTDSSGRDLLVRVAIGGRISLMVGVAAALVAVILGTLYGSLSGYLGGKVDSVMMRLLEILNSFPFMFFVILLVTFFGQNILLIFVAIGMVSWLDMARIVRGQTLSLKRKEFIEAAQVGGVSTASIVLRHIVPQRAGGGGGVCLAAGPQHDPLRILPQFPGTGDAGAAQQLGGIAQRWRQLNGSFALATVVPGGFPGG